MKILIIAPNISKPYLGPSAVAYNTLRGFLKIDKELKSNGVEITFLSINDEIKRKEVTENIEIIGSKRFPLVTFTGEIQALINRMRNRMGNFDVVHSHNLYELAPWLFKKKSIKIYHLHGLAWKEKKYSGFFANIWVPLYEVRLKLYWNKFNKIVTVSQYNLSELSKKGFEVNNVLVIENPVSEEFFKVNKNFENMILYPAGLTPRNFEHLDFYWGHKILGKWTFAVTPAVFFEHYPGGDAAYLNFRSRYKDSETYFLKKWRVKGVLSIQTEFLLSDMPIRSFIWLILKKRAPLFLLRIMNKIEKMLTKMRYERQQYKV